MGYFVRERIFSGCGPNLPQATVVFGVDDLTDDECRILAESVQHYFDEMHAEGGAGPWFFELGPSAAEDAAVFINLKVEWDRVRRELESYRGSSGNSWQAEVYWFHSVAEEQAEIVRGLRAGHTPTAFLQCDCGGGYETFDCVDDLTSVELKTLETILGAELHERGQVLRIIADQDAEAEPAEYVRAKLGWKEFEEAMKQEHASEELISAGKFAFECMEEIRALRRKPIARGEVADEKQVASEGADRGQEGTLVVEDEDAGGPPVVIDLAGAIMWGPRHEVGGERHPIDDDYEWSYQDHLYRLPSGQFVRIRHRTHRAIDRDFEPTAKRFSDAEAAEWLLFGGFTLPADIADLASNHRFQDYHPKPQKTEPPGEKDAGPSPLKPSEDLRKTYRDPDNYWRNVWLYEQRKAGKTNTVILAELANKATEFAQIESENALRTAIDAIALHHNWPMLKGRAGRPSAKSR